MQELDEHRRDWEELARLDPMWAVVSDPRHRFGRWDEAEFFATGEREVEAVLSRAAELGLPAARRNALEFGCGIGRVTRALAGRFDRNVGVDISVEMLDRARSLHGHLGNVEFVHNTAADLRCLGEERFDLVYSRHVLQHLPDEQIARGYLQEMIRLVRPGGLVLAHVPLSIPLRHRLLVTRRAYGALRRAGVPETVLYRRLRLHPVSMLAIPEGTIRAWIEGAGGVVAAVDSKHGRVLSANVYATRDTRR